MLFQRATLLLVYPMAALVVLTFVVLIRLFRSRVSAVRSGQLTIKYYRVFQGESEPESTLKPARHFVNLFEAPTLFYAGCLAAMVTGDHGLLLLGLAWAYVVARLAHAWIHLGGNRVRYRVRAYFLGWVVLLALWVHVVVHVIELRIILAG
jgi:hypothetical protein